MYDCTLNYTLCTIWVLLLQATCANRIVVTLPKGRYFASFEVFKTVCLSSSFFLEYDTVLLGMRSPTFWRIMLPLSWMVCSLFLHCLPLKLKAKIYFETSETIHLTKHRPMKPRVLTYPPCGSRLVWGANCLAFSLVIRPKGWPVSLNIEPIPVLVHRLTNKVFAHCTLHPNRPSPTNREIIL